MKYLHHDAECQFSKNCPEMYIGIPSQFADMTANQKKVDILLEDVLTFSPTPGFKVTLRWQLVDPSDSTMGYDGTVLGVRIYSKFLNAGSATNAL